MQDSTRSDKINEFENKIHANDDMNNNNNNTSKENISKIATFNNNTNDGNNNNAKTKENEKENINNNATKKVHKAVGTININFDGLKGGPPPLSVLKKKKMENKSEEANADENKEIPLPSEKFRRPSITGRRRKSHEKKSQYPITMLMKNYVSA